MKRLRVQGTLFALRRRFDPEAAERVTRVVPSASAIVAALEPGLRAFLVEELAPSFAHPPSREELVLAFERALANGQLVLDPLPEPIYGFVAQPGEEATVEPEPPVERDWIEVQLQDRDGTLIRGAEISIELPDETTRTERTGEDGRVSLRNIQPGNCKISFVRLHPVERAPEFAPHAANQPN